MCKPQIFLCRIENIQGGEGHIERVVGEHIDQPLARLLGGFGPGRGRKIAQHTQPALADHPLGHFRDDAEHAGDAAGVIVDRAV